MLQEKAIEITTSSSSCAHYICTSNKTNANIVENKPHNM